MTAIHRDYLPERREPAFPRDLAEAITRKAHRCDVRKSGINAPAFSLAPSPALS